MKLNKNNILKLLHIILGIIVLGYPIVGLYIFGYICILGVDIGLSFITTVLLWCIIYYIFKKLCIFLSSTVMTVIIPFLLLIGAVITFPTFTFLASFPGSPMHDNPADGFIAMFTLVGFTICFVMSIIINNLKLIKNIFYDDSKINIKSVKTVDVKKE